MANLWDYEDSIRTYEEQAGEDATPTDVPRWIDQDISPSDVAAIVQGGCGSGAYMPAATYHQALATMNEHGDAVFEYLETQGYDLANLAEDWPGSWAGLACTFLSVAVETWAANVEDELDELLDAIEESEDEEEPTEPEPGDFVLASCGPLGSRTSLSEHGGRHLGEFASEDEAEEEIRRRCKETGVYLDTWFLDDHGGWTLRTLDS